MDEALRDAALAWRRDDPDPDTRAELDALMARADAGDAAAEADLRDRFDGELAFGTAGLRGVLGAGPTRMNRRVALRSTAGLLAHLAAEVPEAKARGLVVGYDGRRLSREMAEDAAAVALGAGFRVFLFDRVIPTPVVAFAAVDRRAAAAVVITASHNPPAYNGYKVYWENGAQIVSPIDAGIAAAIESVGPVRALPRGDVVDAIPLGDALEARYLARVAALQLHPEVPRALQIVYTALHGVGDRLCRAALAGAGFASVHSVPEQAEPDGAFPTVAFPNPEEEGAMDLALALAAREGAELVLANDPDADRLAVATRLDDGTYRMLTGNDVGIALADYLLSEGASEGRRAVINSIVSSPCLGRVAAAHGARWEQVLTGFKWISNRALELEAAGERVVLGYEEALGYSIGDVVRDKDGIGAAVVMAELVAWLKAQGRTLASYLDDLARAHGLFLSRQVSLVRPGPEGAATIRAHMERVRAEPPAALGRFAVAARSDALTGVRVDVASEAESTLALPEGDVLSFELVGGHRVMLRPSGTEPKLKLYFDVRVEPADGEAVEEARARGEATLDHLVAAVEALVAE
jgi:phosphomannomutase